MKKFILITAFLTIAVLLSSVKIFAQSDYEIVQNFKVKYLQIEDSIKAASSLDDIYNLATRVDKLENEYSQYKDLLDKSLYPDDFKKSFDKLKRQIAVKEKDVQQITTLKTQVSGLKIQVDDLTKKNNELITKVQLLGVESKKDKDKIAQLEKTVENLKTSLQKRDILVMTMIDSLVPINYNERTRLTQQDKQKMLSEAEKNNVLSNIKKSVKDNIKFLQVTTLNPSDLNDMKKQEEDFVKTWKSVGPMIAEIYSSRGQRANDLQDINQLFKEWNEALKIATWSSIRQDFTNYRIILQEFNSGKEFTNNLVNYVNDEIKNADSKSKQEAKNAYKSFADSAWFGIVKPEWVPYLIDNQMMTAGEKDSIESRISVWNAKVNPGGINWPYVIIALLLIVIVVLLIARRKSKSPPKDIPVT